MTADCPTCTHADKHGWLGRTGSHCRQCHRDWWGTAQMHCVTCHRHFTSASACHKHLLPHGCVDPAEARTKTGAPVFAVTDRRGGQAWSLAGSDTRYSHLQRSQMATTRVGIDLGYGGDPCGDDEL